jgi:hypothetical protein
MHASQCRRLRFRTGPPHIAHAIGVLGRASMVGVRHLRVAYGRGCEALRGVASSGDRSGPEMLRCLFPDLAASVRGDALLLNSDSRKVCVSPAAIDRSNSRQCGSVSAPVRAREAVLHCGGEGRCSIGLFGHRSCAG